MKRRIYIWNGQPRLIRTIISHCILWLQLTKSKESPKSRTRKVCSRGDNCSGSAVGRLHAPGACNHAFSHYSLFEWYFEPEMRLGTLLLHRVVVLILIDERFNKHNAKYSLREWSRIENSNDTRTARTSRPTADPLQLVPREHTFLDRDFGLSFGLGSHNHRIQSLMMVLISPRNPEVKRSILKRAVSSIEYE